MRILVIDRRAYALDWAMRCRAAGHEVKWYIATNPDGSKNHVGDGLIEKVDDYKRWRKWPDLVLLTDNTHYLTDMDYWRRDGVAVVGATPASAELELDRAKGQALFKTHKIPVLDTKEFNDYDAAIAYVAKEDDRFVSKVEGSAEDKALSYVSQSPDDMVYMIQRWKKNNKLKGSFILQRFCPGTEMAVGAWLGPDGFLPGWCENFEFKKLMDGDLGVATGEQGTVLRYVPRSKLADKVLKPLEEALVGLGHTGYVDVNCIIDDAGEPWPLEWTCFDDQTEILTESGWKFFKDLVVGESVATMNPDTDELQYKPCSDVIHKHYRGDLIHFGGTSSAPDFCVTPDHRMYVREQHRKSWEFIEARRLGKTYYQVKRTSKWAGVDTPEFVLPKHVEIHQLGRHKKSMEIVHPELRMPMEVWMRFLGLYLSEGSMGKHGYQTSISQSPKNMHKILPLLEGFPIRPEIQKKGGVQFSSIQLGKYLKSFNLGLCDAKHVPQMFKSLAPKYLAALLDGLMAGDGSTHKRTGQRNYYTTSRRLADDVQELMLKLGYLGRIVKCPVKGTKFTIGSKEYTRRHDGYVVCERREKTLGWLDKRLTERVPYDGTVYCCTVPPYYLVYVRRNGNAAWCGNCRPGWPTFNIQQALHDGDPAEWLLNLVQGTSTASPFQMRTVATGVVMSIPDYPYSKLTKKEVSGIPVYGLNGRNTQHLHPCEMMLGSAPKVSAGKVQTVPMLVTAGDYVLVSTGTGATVRASKARAYRALESLTMPNSPMWRTDIGQRLRAQLLKLQRHGYATGMSY